MDEMNWSLPPDLELALEHFYSAPEPSPAFASHLEEALAVHQAQLLRAETSAAPASDESLPRLSQSGFERLKKSRLWRRLAARGERKDIVNMNSKWKLAWTIALVLLGLILVSTVAYALYHYFSDPGLQAVSDAGLVSDLNVTAQPTVLPTPTPPLPAAVIGQQQTLENITVALDWVYLNDSFQSFGFSVRGLAPELILGMPVMSFGRLSPDQYGGDAGLQLTEKDGVVTGNYAIYQIVRDPATYEVADTYTDVGVDIPIEDKAGHTLKTFHFDAPKLLVHLDTSATISNTFASRSNAVEIRLQWVKLGPKEVQTRLCYDLPAGQDWNLETAALQLAGAGQDLFKAAKLANEKAVVVSTENGVRCSDVTFPTGVGDAREFNLIVDSLRLVVTVRVDGLNPAGDFYASLVDKEGRDINSSSSPEQSGNDPNLYSITFVPEDMSGRSDPTFSPGNPLSGEYFKGQMVVVVGGSDPVSNPEAAFRFDLDLPVHKSIALEPKQSVTANGVEMRLERIDISPSYTKIFLCYRKPSKEDWTIGNTVTLQVGDSQASATQWSVLYDKDSLESNPNNSPEENLVRMDVEGGRCVMVDFSVGHHNQPETLTLTVPELERSIPEMISDAEIQKAREKLSAQGIEMDWVSSFGGGPNGPIIKKKPDEMSDQQVIRLFYAALGYYYPGPWVFTVDINP